MNVDKIAIISWFKPCNRNSWVYVHTQFRKIVDCEQSLFFFGKVEGSARFDIARLRAARNEGASPRKLFLLFAIARLRAARNEGASQRKVFLLSSGLHPPLSQRKLEYSCCIRAIPSERALFFYDARLKIIMHWCPGCCPAGSVFAHL